MTETEYEAEPFTILAEQRVTEAVLGARRHGLEPAPSVPIVPISENSTTRPPLRVGPPSRHHMALMIWVAVFPTLTMLNMLLRGLLDGSPIVVRTLVLATVAVPIVIYGLMPLLLRVRTSLLAMGMRP